VYLTCLLTCRIPSAVKTEHAAPHGTVHGLKPATVNSSGISSKNRPFSSYFSTSPLSLTSTFPPPLRPFSHGDAPAIDPPTFYHQSSLSSSPQAPQILTSIIYVDANHTAPILSLSSSLGHPHPQSDSGVVQARRVTRLLSHFMRYTRSRSPNVQRWPVPR
jgi:hypothetical protein